MIIERKEENFKSNFESIKIGQTFIDNDDYLYIKVKMMIVLIVLVLIEIAKFHLMMMI